MADSPPSASMCCRYHPLGKGGGSALTPPPTKTEARPSSWSPSLLAPSAHVVDLILLHAEEALGGGPAACRTAEPRDLSGLGETPERGWTRRQPTPPPGVCCSDRVFTRGWGGPSPALALRLCWSSDGAEGVGSTLASSGEPRVPLFRQ